MKIFIVLLLTFIVFQSCERNYDGSVSSLKSKEVAFDQLNKQRGDKITVCHATGNGNFHPINISQNAVEAHLAHGDYLSDADDDGFTRIGACIGSKNDCNDNDAGVFPGAEEVCGDGKDNNCDGNIDEGCCTYPDNLIGTWTGTGVQGLSTWAISLSISCDAITASYPSLGCAGSWELIDAIDNTYHFREVITSGGGCVSPCGLLVSLLPNGTLFFESVPSECSGAVGQGTLTKD